MNVLVACEYSGVVRDAFAAKGHNAWSCDIIPTEADGNHILLDVREVLTDGWDLMIAHPPCTHLCVSGARWFPDKKRPQREALNFVLDLMNAPIEMIAIENPVSIISTFIRKPEQVIHPWQFGDPFEKTTCLWLKNLPRLKPTNILKVYDKKFIHHLPPTADRAKIRSKTFNGIASAMAHQWTKPVRKIGFNLSINRNLRKGRNLP